MTHQLYSELARWWPLLSPPADYVEEAEFFRSTLVAAGLPDSPSFLELGSGGGHNAFHLKHLFDPVMLTDLAPDMLAESQKLNPDCEHAAGDMRSLRLGRLFDVVFIHDAIDYMRTVEDLRGAVETAFVHCKPGGLALMVPDYVKETFISSTEHGGTDGEDRSLRYLEWSYDPDSHDTHYTTQYVYVLREDSRPVRVESEEHICGLFPRSQWLVLLGEAGFHPEIILDPYGREAFLSRRPKR